MTFVMIEHKDSQRWSHQTHEALSLIASGTGRKPEKKPELFLKRFESDAALALARPSAVPSAGADYYHTSKPATNSDPISGERFLVTLSPSKNSTANGPNHPTHEPPLVLNECGANVRSSGKHVFPRIFQDEKQRKIFAHLRERRRRSDVPSPAEGDLKVLRETREIQWKQIWGEMQNLREPQELETKRTDILSVIRGRKLGDVQTNRRVEK